MLSERFRIIKLRSVLPVTVIIVILGARFWSLQEDVHAKYLAVSMKSSASSVAQVFFNIGKGFSDENSSKVEVYKNDEFKEYRFRLPDYKYITNLRFDPLASNGHIVIKQISIIDGLGNIFYRLDPKEMTAASQIRQFDIINDKILIDTELNAIDPQIHIQLEKPFRKKIHPSYNKDILISFVVIVITVLFIYLWVNWNDNKHIKRLIYHIIITAGFITVAIYCLQTSIGILNRSIQPFGGGDTEVYLHMAALKWINPFFYHGLRPPTVPFLYSLVNGSENTYNIILLQVIISCASWLFLAVMTVYYLTDYLAKIFAFFLIAFIPLNGFMHYWNLVMLSESLSFSFLALFLAIFLWYYNKKSISSVILLSITALLLAFTRDTDAYRVLLMVPPIFLLIIQQIRNSTRRVLRHAVLFIVFILIFIGSNYSTSNILCRDCVTSHMNARWFMPTMNNLFQRILPFEDRLKFFSDSGLPVTPELMAMKNKWASSNNWQSAFDPKLAPQREWNYFHGRQTYMKYLINNPTYVLSSVFEYINPLIYLDGTSNAWFYDMSIPIEARFLSIFFLNNDRDLKMLFVLLPASLIFILLLYMKRIFKHFREHIRIIFLMLYIMLITVPIGILIFHGDLMDLSRHSFTNIIQLNLGIVLFYLFMADLLMIKMREDAETR